MQRDQQPRLKVRHVVVAAVCLVAAIAGMRAVRAAETHPAMTADAPPGWQLHVALPGQEFRPRGRYSDSRTSCLLDLASDAKVQPDGTKLACIRIERKDGR